jgi:hypothetical protein
MQQFRKIGGFVRLLAALFLLAQFAGVVASPLQSAQAFADAADFHMHHHHMHVGNDVATAGHHDGQLDDHVDHCCALHAFFAGIIPAAIAVEAVDIIGQRLALNVIDFHGGLEPGRFDRPPRPYALI